MKGEIVPVLLSTFCNAWIQNLKSWLHCINLASHPTYKQVQSSYLDLPPLPNLAPDPFSDLPLPLSLTSIQPFWTPCRVPRRLNPILLKGLIFLTATPAPRRYLHGPLSHSLYFLCSNTIALEKYPATEPLSPLLSFPPGLITVSYYIEYLCTVLSFCPWKVNSKGQEMYLFYPLPEPPTPWTLNDTSKCSTNGFIDK